MTDARSPLFEEVPCNLCGSARSRELYNRPYPAAALDDLGNFAATTDAFDRYGRIVACRDCGLVFTNPRLKSGELVKGYVNATDELYTAESASRSINAHISIHTLKRFASSGRLLEIGASTGYFLNAARVDFEVVGLEPSAWACGIARRLGLEMHAETLESCAQWEAESFDVVALIDVIEHLPDPAGALKACARLLKPGGILYLVTPDIGSLSARLLRGYWWGLRPAHIYYFDRRTMRRTLEKAGLETVYEKSFGRIFSYDYWSSRLRSYPRFLHWGVDAVIRALGLQSKFLYLDTRDSMELCARKTGGAARD